MSKHNHREDGNRWHGCPVCEAEYRFAGRDLGNWTPERLAERIATGECGVADDWCFTHETVADFGHYLRTRKGRHSPQGFAYDD